MATDGSKQLRAASPTAAPPPARINVHRFAETRASELQSLHSIVSNRLNNDFTAPRNKRRRTTGHDNRTSKNRFRKKQKLSVSKDDDSLQKAPSRSDRRKFELKGNPQSGFSCSVDGTRRLRTHVWHAKRFSMTKRWGFHLPLGLPGRGKGSKSLLKWLKNGVVVHDASYHSAVQLEGPEDSLLSILSTVMVPSPSTYSEEVSCKVLSGAKYANSLLYHVVASNTNLIAPVTYMWRSLHQHFSDANSDVHSNGGCDGSGKVCSLSSFRQVWVWIHAAAFREGYDALKAACQGQGKIDEPGTLVSCISLEGKLAKLEVMGSKAFQLLRKILHPVARVSNDSSLLRKCSFVERYSVSQQNEDSIQQIKECILENEHLISSNSIISLTLKDPRYLTTKGVGVVSEAIPTGLLGQTKENRIKESENLAGITERHKESGLSLCIKPDECCDLSVNMDLWDASLGVCPPLEESVLCMEKHHRRLATFSLGERSTRELNASTKEQFSRFCPTLLLRCENVTDSVTRWSVILPLSWAKIFWIPIVSGGARAIGLREKRWVACEVGLPYFPSEFPDCSAYSFSMATEAAAVDETASLRPPSMRPLSIPIPPPWECIRFAFVRNFTGAEDTQFNHSKLCAEKVASDNSSTNSSKDFEIAASSNHMVVARTSKMLTKLLTDMNGDRLLLFSKKADERTCILKNMRDEKLISLDPARVNSLINDKKLYFLRVHLHAYKEGFFEEGAVICAPHLADINLWTPRSENNNVEFQVPQSSIASYFVQQPSGKWELQVPEDPVAMQSHRWPIGFVTTGFVHGSKKPVAGALCEAILLACLREEQWNAVPLKKRRKEIYVLVRNMRSTAYRLALANIILEEREEDIDYI